MEDEDPEMPSSPRKKLKLQENILNTSVQPVPIMMAPATDAQLGKEAKVGILEFVSPGLPGFHGVLKKRYTDFLVNEILPSGEVVHLDDLRKPQRPDQSDKVESVASVPAQEITQLNEDPVQLLRATDLVHDVATSQRSVAELVGETEEKKSVDAEKKLEDPAHGWQVYASKPEGCKLTPEDETLLKSFFDGDVVSQMLALYNRVVNSPHRRLKDYGTVKSDVITDRGVRTSIHQAIRNIFRSRLESSTDDKGAMIVSAGVGPNKWGHPANRGRNQHGGNRGGRENPQKARLGWKELGGDYLHFTLYKENKDTMEVISYLARLLKVKPQAFDFAGTKDRRGVTVQRVSVYRMRAEALISVGHTLRNAKIGNYEYRPHGLDLGDLTGNEFIITLRDCQFPSMSSEQDEARIREASSTVDLAVRHLQEQGYLNYYGLQRFGTFATRTDTVGLKMLQGDFKGAIDCILDFSKDALAANDQFGSDRDLISTDDKARAKAIDSFRTTAKAYPALEILPRKFSAESNIIRHLSGPNRDNDYMGALQTIPRALRLIYVHAYQSLVWNFAASERWRLHGDEVQIGDLVLVNEHKDKVEEHKPDEIDADGEVVIQPGINDSATTTEDSFTRARALTEKELQSGQYTIFDVVLPTPGYDILYPANAMAEFYKSFMQSERGGGLDPFNMRRSWRDVSLSGSYRKLLGRPGPDISSEIRSYMADNEQFVKTDADRLGEGQQKRSDLDQSHDHGNDHGNGNGLGNGNENGNAKPNNDDPSLTKPGANSSTHITKELSSAPSPGPSPSTEPKPATPTETEPESKPTPKKLAVILKLQLGSSQYATMALRELMKHGGVKTYKPDFGGGR